MRLTFAKPVTAGLAAAFLAVASASAAVPSLERQGLPAPTETALVGVQLASACGNWQPSAYSQSENCPARRTGSDPTWVKQGDRGSQDHSFDAHHGYSSQESKDKDDKHPPCLC